MLFDRAISALVVGTVVASWTLSASVAAAQTPTLTSSQQAVVPGSSVTLTISGPPGEHFAVIGSLVGAGASFGGSALAVGTDYQVVAQGVLDGSGQGTAPFTAPFLGSVIDRVYLQAATSVSPEYSPLALSPGLVLRNNDLVSGLGGPAGAVGPTGPIGPAGPMGMMGVAGPMGAMGPMGPVGPMGPAGGSGAAGVGYRTDCADGNLALWNSTSSTWVCSAAVTNVTAAVQALTVLVGALEVDAYLDSLSFQTAFPVGSELAVGNNNGGTACHFQTGSYILDVIGNDNTIGFTGGLVNAFDMSMGNASYSPVPITTAQVLARCATGRPYTTKQ